MRSRGGSSAEVEMLAGACKAGPIQRRKGDIIAVPQGELQVRTRSKR